MEYEALREFGLNEREAKVYLELLSRKSATASEIAKGTGVNRTTVYLELDNLIQRGLASYVIKESVRYFQPAPPSKTLDILEEKKRRLQEVLPRLESMHQVAQPFSIEVFEGKEGIKTFYQDIYDSCDSFDVFGATGKAMDVLKYSYPHFLKKFFERGITERALANEQARSVMERHPENILVRYLSEEFRAEVTTLIYADKVAIQSLHEDNIYVIVISDPLLHSSYKNYFEFMWSQADS